LITGKTRIIFALVILSAVGALVFLPAVNAGFVKSWDDDKYVVDNPLVQSMSAGNLAKIATSFLLGNYHPLTLTVFAVQYQLFRLDARGYHAVSVTLHLLNCLLVFWLIYLIAGNLPAAFLAGLIFGLHPLRVESVAWISDQKDLLAAGFALLTIIGYLYFRKDRRIAFYILALLSFTLSLLAKASALFTPLILLLVDFNRDRKFDKRKILDTIPFFFVALILGILSLAARNSYQSQLGEHVFTIGQKIVIGIDRLIFYFIGRNFFPGPYPFLNTYYLARNGLPVVPTVIAATILAGLVFAVIYSLRFTKKILWAFAFFGIFILPAVFAVSLGYSADRFIYLPAVGIAFLAGEYIVWLYGTLYRKTRIARYLIIAFSFGLIAILAVMTRQGISVWRDSLSLTDHFVKTYPDDPTAYLNRGLAFQEAKKSERAIADLGQSLAINPEYAEAYNRRALIYYRIRNYERAIADFSSAVRIDPNYAEVYYNRGNLYYDLAAFTEAETDYTRAIALDPSRAETFYNRGNVRARLGDVGKAIDDYTRAIALDPGHTRAYYNRAVSYYLLKEYKSAYEDFQKLIALGVKLNPAVLDTLQKYMKGKDK